MIRASRRLTPRSWRRWCKSYPAGDTICANSAIAGCWLRARVNQGIATIAKDVSRPASGDIQAFVQRSRAIRAITRRQPRLIFALDATASREPTWEQARHWHAELFSSAVDSKSLAVQLVYFRGLAELSVSEWFSSPDDLLLRMNNVSCCAGTTQIASLLSHSLRAGSSAHPIRSLVFIGDACEEPPSALFKLAGQHGIRKIPIFMFQEGYDPHVKQVFRRIAQLSGGAYAPFDAHSGSELRVLLQSVARFASGGVAALERSGREADHALLQQLTAPKDGSR